MIIPGVAAAILAGGRGARVGGRPKPLLAVGGRALITRQLGVLTALFDEVLVAVGEREEIVAALPPSVRAVTDPVAGAGPLGGILAALAAARAPHVVCIAGDMPELAPALLALVAAPGDDSDVVIPVVAGFREPLLARYATRLAPRLRLHLDRGGRRATDLAGLGQTREIAEADLRAADPELRSFRNLNHPEDFE